MEDVTSVILIENASARKVLDISRPIWSLLKIVLRAPRCDVLRSERDVEIIVEIAVERRDPQEFPSHSLANSFDFLIGARATTAKVMSWFSRCGSRSVM